MRLAILYSGRVSGYDKFYNNLKKNILQDHEVDFFLSNGKELGEDLTGFIELYKPKIVITDPVEFQLQLDEKTVINHKNYLDYAEYIHYNGHFMIINRYRLFQKFKEYCKTNNVHYDFIMVSRVDLDFVSKIDFRLFRDPNAIYIPILPDSQGICDLLSISSNFELMEKYNDLALYLDQYWVECGIKSRSTEKYMAYHLKRMNVMHTVRRFPMICFLRDGLWCPGFLHPVTLNFDTVMNILPYAAAAAPAATN